MEMNEIIVEDAVEVTPAPAEETVAERYARLNTVKTKGEAVDFLDHLINTNIEKTGNSAEMATIVEKSNIGYLLGAFPHEERLRLEDLFQTEHPLFGPASAGPLTIERAFAAGFNFAKRSAISKLEELHIRVGGQA